MRFPKNSVRKYLPIKVSDTGDNQEMRAMKTQGEGGPSVEETEPYLDSPRTATAATV